MRLLIYSVVWGGCSSQADDDEISRNIVVLANTRPDIFGSTEEEMSAIVQEKIKEKRAEMAGAGGKAADEGVAANVSQHAL